MILLQSISDEIIAPLLPEGSHISIKTINDGEKQICIDNHKRQNSIDTYSDTIKISNRHISLTINWTDDYTETETIANKLYDEISSLENKEYENFYIKFISMDYNMPVDNKRTDLEVYSKTIDFEIYYELRR